VDSRSRRYPSDTTGAQWAVIDPLLPDPAWLVGKGGRPEVHCRRAIVDAIFYVVDNGVKWRALPADFPPWSTVYNYFAAWEAAGITQDVLDALRDRVRLAEGRVAALSAAIIDSQSVKAAETVGRSSRGFDAGKKITAASGTSPWTPWDCCCVCWSPPRRCRTATAPGHCLSCWPPRAGGSG
jgi:transposase